MKRTTQHILLACLAVAAQLGVGAVQVGRWPAVHSHTARQTTAGSPRAAVASSRPAEATAPAPVFCYKDPARLRAVRLFGVEVARVSATSGLVAAMALGFAVQQCAPATVTRLLCKSNAGLAKGQLWRLVTPALAHASLGHLAANTMSLTSVGPAVEAWFGARRTVGAFACGCAGGALAGWRANASPSVGASGGVCGLVGAWAMFLAQNGRILAKGSARSGLAAVGKAVGAGALQALTGGGGGGGGDGGVFAVDHAAHLGGLLAGAMAAAVFGPVLHFERRGHFRSVSGALLLQTRPAFESTTSAFTLCMGLFKRRSREFDHCITCYAPLFLVSVPYVCSYFDPLAGLPVRHLTRGLLPRSPCLLINTCRYLWTARAARPGRGPSWLAPAGPISG